MKTDPRIHDIESLLEQHNDYRDSCLNLIASENVPSPLVEGLLAEELSRRYGYYLGTDLRRRHYQGNRYITRIEELAHERAKELFGVAHVDLRPLSGNVAGIAAMCALTRPGDVVLEVANGHQYGHKLAACSLAVSLTSIEIPWDGVACNIDLEPTLALIEEHGPRVVNIGSGLFLFPQPVRQIKEAMRRRNPDSYLIYDAAHVMGLIAGGRFQDPLGEGADMVITSTHKTLAGPQGGMILTNDASIAERMAPALAPLLVANHHLGRLPALAATFVEWLTCGPAHANAIIENARALARALEERGVPMAGAHLGYTESHTLLPIVDAFGEGKELADRLEECHVITGASELPPDLGTHGLRLGVQELTRRGMTTADAPAIAACIADVLEGRDLGGARERAIELARGFDQMRFTVE